MPGGVDGPAVFELINGPLAQSAPSVLGLWATTAPAREALAFGASPESGEAVVAWRTNLPADPAVAAARLEAGKAQLEAAQQALPAAEARLEAFVRAQAAREPGLPFEAFAPLAAPEAELLASLSELGQSQQPASFGLGEALAERWQAAADEFGAFVEQLVQVLGHYAWVETRVEDRLLGWTAVGWTGDVDTAWQGNLAPREAALHQRTLGLALASRTTLIRTFVQAARGALQLSVLVTVPGGPILALPLAWRFIHQVLDELTRHPQ